MATTQNTNPNGDAGQGVTPGTVVEPTDATIENRANEILVLRRPSRRSSWYGVPGYISAVGWILLSAAARDDNIQYFNNRREPRWCVILQNLEPDDDLEKTLQEAFKSQLDQPHRNIFIPIEGDGKITFQKMSDDTKDVSFERLQDRADQFILVAHRIPPDRLGTVRVGPLGGNATIAASRVYKEAVVSTSQNLLADRINRFIAAEGPVAATDLKWKWMPTELDLTSDGEDVTAVAAAFTNNVMQLDEARKRLKLPPVGDPDGKKFFYQIVGKTAAGNAASTFGAATIGARLGATEAQAQQANKSADHEDALERLREVDDVAREALDVALAARDA